MILETYTGKLFDYEAPTPEMIELTDIARALSQIARFGGHSARPYSVASHALLVRAIVGERTQQRQPELELAALHHDSHEAYIGDIPTPLKAQIRAASTVYDDMRDVIDDAIAAKLGINHYLLDDPRVVQADADALYLEARRLKQSRAEGPFWADIRERATPGVTFPPFYKWGAYRDPVDAQAAFIRAHEALTREITLRKATR